MDNLDIYPGALPSNTDHFIVSGVVDDGEVATKVPDDEADFFSVYAVDTDGVESCIADFPDRETADDLAELLEYSARL